MNSMVSMCDVDLQEILRALPFQHLHTFTIYASRNWSCDGRIEFFGFYGFLIALSQLSPARREAKLRVPSAEQLLRTYVTNSLKVAQDQAAERCADSPPDKISEIPTIRVWIKGLKIWQDKR